MNGVSRIEELPEPATVGAPLKAVPAPGVGPEVASRGLPVEVEPAPVRTVPAAALSLVPAQVPPLGTDRRPPPGTDRRPLFGLPMDALDLDEAVQRCMHAVAYGPAIEVGVLNAAKLVLMRTNRALSDAVSSADLLLADGQSVVWASRFLGQPLPGRVAGIDLFTALLAAAERDGRSVYLLGAKPDVLARTVAEVRRRHPLLRIAGSRDGYFSDDEAPAVAAAIRATGAELLFLGMTSPKKETFCARYGEATGARVTHGVGGSFDVLAGVVRRAPRLWQVIGMEWLYRVLQEPFRLGPRYLKTNSRFVRLTLAERRRPTPVPVLAPRARGAV